MEGLSFHGQDPLGGEVDAEYLYVELLPMILGRLLYRAGKHPENEQQRWLRGGGGETVPVG